MTNKEKIKAIRNKIASFGGTTISFDNVNTFVGFGASHDYDDHYMFRGVSADDKIIGRNGKGNEIHIPIHWLDEFILSYMVKSYLGACKEQLTESAYKEIEELIAD